MDENRAPELDDNDTRSAGRKREVPVWLIFVIVAIVSLAIIYIAGLGAPGG